MKIQEGKTPIGRLMARCRYLLIVVTGMMVAGSVYAQSGYLGKLNGLELRAGIAPTQHFQNVVRNDESIQRLKIGNMSYRLAYSRLLARNFEITAGYEFARINCISNNILFHDVDTFVLPDQVVHEVYYKSILDDPAMNYHGGSVSFLFYRLGSLAPIGKFIGFSISGGVTRLKEGEPVVIGHHGDVIAQSFFRRKSVIDDQETFLIPEPVAVRSFHLKARLGRNYPLTEELMLSVGMAATIISTYETKTISVIGPFMQDLNDVSVESSWTNYVMNSVRFYNRITFEMALKYHF